MINIIPIGSGSSGNCFYIQIDNKEFLIDMGIGYRKVKDALESNDRSLNNISAIFITHGHYDHIKAKVAITNNTKCDLYGNESLFYCLSGLRSKFNILDFESVNLVNDIEVKMFKVGHDFNVTTGYTFTYKNQKVAYVTDCGKVTKAIYAELKNSNVVIIESNHDIEMLKNGSYPYDLKRRILSSHGHLSNEDCAKVINSLREDGSKNFLLAHLSRENNRPEIARKEVMDKVINKDIRLYICPIEGKELLKY